MTIETPYEPPSRVLIDLLKSSNDPIVLAVAAHDLGQYVKYYDQGKK